MPYRALTSAPIASMLRRVAKDHGYTSERGPRAGEGDPVQLAIALGTGELATVLLSDESRSMAIKWLDEQAKIVDDFLLAEALKDIADALYLAVQREHDADEAELRSYLNDVAHE